MSNARLQPPRRSHGHLATSSRARRSACWTAAVALALAAAACGEDATRAEPEGARGELASDLPRIEPNPVLTDPPPQPASAPTPSPAGGGEAMGVVPLEPAPVPAPGEAAEESESPPPVTLVVLEPPGPPPVECAPLANAGSLEDGDINVDLASEFQRISGFGGISMPRWIADLTPQQAFLAFGDGQGQLGLSLLRVSVPQDPADFALEVPTAQRAVALGAKVFATPWTPPPGLKSNGELAGGELLPENYGAYADHLLSFRDFMASNGVQLEAMSVQNEPDISVSYDSCDWTSEQIGDFLREQGPRFGDTKLMAAESYNFNRQVTDPLLNDDEIAAQFDIVAGHIYGNGLLDYPLARERGKEVWMTEHYTDSGSEPDRANLWPLAYNVAVELQRSMLANFNAYVWWYIRRGYGLITEDGVVSKRGYLLSQFSRFIRPGYVRVAASTPDADGVSATAYKNGAGSVVVVVLNQATEARDVGLDVFGSCVTGFDRFTTSETKDVEREAAVALDVGRANVTLEPLSVTTFVSQPIPPPPAAPAE